MYDIPFELSVPVSPTVFRFGSRKNSGLRVLNVWILMIESPFLPTSVNVFHVDVPSYPPLLSRDRYHGELKNGSVYGYVCFVFKATRVESATAQKTWTP